MKEKAIQRKARSYGVGTVKGEEDTSGQFPEAARTLEERFGEIFEAYERQLNEIGSLLVVGRGNTREQLETNARDVLSRAARVLRGEEASLLAVEEEIYRNIEASVEPLNPHPDESLRAGVELCKAAVSVVVRNLPPSSVSPEKLAEISLAVQDIVLDRVSRMVMASYVDYLLTKVRETQAEERRRFSRELHDRLAHEMVSVNQSLELYEALQTRDPEAAARRLRSARETVVGAIDLMREFATELKMLETSEGLRIAMENLMKISVPPGVEYEVGFEGEEEHLPEYVRDQLYMILREGVRNAVAHSRSDRIDVTVGISPREVTATIRDSGVGLGVDGAFSEGLGLGSMRERADLLGGSLKLVSEPASGAKIEVHLPLVRRRDA